MSTAENEPTRAPVAYWQGLFSLPRAIWMPIIAMSVIAVGAFFFNEWSVRHIKTSAVTLASLTAAQKELSELRTQLMDAETGQREYLLNRDPEGLERHEESLALLPVIGERLRLHVESDALLLSQVQRLEALRSRVLVELRAQAVAAGQAPPEAEHSAMESFRAEADKVRDVFEQRVAHHLAETARNAQLTRVAFAALTLVLLLLLFVAVRLLVTDYWRQEAARRVQSDERLRLEQLVAERTKELFDLTAYLQTAAEREKATLARDLHDELGGLLTAAKMDLSWLQGRASTKEPEAQTKLGALGEALDEAMDVKRRVVENLRPALLDHFGLATALRAHFEETCQKAGIALTARISSDFEQLPQDLAIALFRVGQESLTNILKHAKAENVELELALDPGNYRILIVDDGVGIAPERLEGTRSHGLAGMRHRIATLGGAFTIAKNPPHGTRIVVSVPRVRGH